MDEIRRRRVSDDIEGQGAQRMPREVHIGEWIAVAVALVIVLILIWWAT